MDENEIVTAVCAHLQSSGWVIESRLHTTQQGVDIVARHASGRKLYVEAKGGTSSREGSARYGRPYTQSQVFDRVAKGVYTTLELRARYPSTEDADVALAVPDSKLFQRYLEPVTEQLRASGIGILFVGDDQSVTVR